MVKNTGENLISRYASTVQQGLFKSKERHNSLTNTWPRPHNIENISSYLGERDREVSWARENTNCEHLAANDECHNEQSSSQLLTHFTHLLERFWDGAGNKVPVNLENP